MPFDAAPVRSPLPDNIAGQSALVLDMVEFYFRGGERWLRGTWQRGEQRCLMGAVRFVRSEVLCYRDQAEVYLARAINPPSANASPARSRTPRSRTKTNGQLARKASVAARSKVIELWCASIVMSFNDANGRTYSEIAAVLSTAKELAEADARAEVDTFTDCAVNG
jgi:hypothetical protein